MTTTPRDEGTEEAQAPVEALDALLSAARGGDGGASCRLGDLYLEGGAVEQDVDEAFRWYSLGASQGDALAQSHLGTMFLRGTGCRADDDRAVFWFRRSADQGNATGQYNLARRYLLGEGVAPDPIEAARWFAGAAAQGDLVSTYELGTLFRFGRGVKRDLVTAASLHLIVAKRGVVAAEVSLADCLEELQDVALAGNLTASRCLCEMHNLGLGVEESASLTWTWIKWAKDHCRTGGDADSANEVSETYEFYGQWLREADRHEGERVLAALLRPFPRALRARPLPRVRFKRRGRSGSGGEKESA
jgi:TPR repeat protein